MKNQRQCGSCWGVFDHGSLEGACFIAAGNMSLLSEQQRVDCDTVDSAWCAHEQQFRFRREERHVHGCSCTACKASSCTVLGSSPLACRF